MLKQAYFASNYQLRTHFFDFILGQKAWGDDDVKKCCLIQNAKNIGIVDTVFKELVGGKSFGETFNFVRNKTRPAK